MTGEFKSMESLAGLLDSTADEIKHASRGLGILEDILENMPFILVLGDGENWIAVSKSFSTLLGWTREDLQTRTWLEIIHPDDLKETFEEAARVVNTTKVGHITNRYRIRGGGYRLLSWTWGPPGRSGYTLCMGQDLGPGAE